MLKMFVSIFNFSSGHSQLGTSFNVLLEEIEKGGMVARPGVCGGGNEGGQMKCEVEFVLERCRPEQCWIPGNVAG